MQATGCGKTHTISGTQEDPGVIFLTMKELYRLIDERADESIITISLSYLEIYNETIRDLLSEQPTPSGAGLALRDQNGKITVAGITERAPKNAEDVRDMIAQGNERRTMSPTEANAVSSRSHAVLQINVTQQPRTAGTSEERTSASLNIIDLAGSERAAATRNNGQRMKEGANINKSLLALGNCINALCSADGRKGRHIPYRNSKLTRLLKFSLGGNCKTVMIVCVSPSSAHFEETNNTLLYANRAKNIRTKVTRNTMNVDRHVGQYVAAIAELNQEVAELKAKLKEKGSLESATEKRRRLEMAQEVEESKKSMRATAESVKKSVLERAGAEAQLRAAEVRKQALQVRLSEVQRLLAEASASASAHQPDLESERTLLQNLIAREEAVLGDAHLVSSAHSLRNSLEMQHATFVAAARNTKFDAEASEAVRAVGERLEAQIEAARSKAHVELLLQSWAAECRASTGLLALATRCTVAMKEAAGDLEYRATSLKRTRAEAEGEDAELSEGLAALAQQFREVAEANDTTLENIAGSRTAEVKATTASARPALQAIKRARHSMSATPPSARPAPATRTVAGGSTAAALGNTSAISRNVTRGGLLSPQRGSSERAPPAQRVAASYAVPTAASRAHLVSSPRRVAISPRRVLRRQSMAPIAGRTGAAGSAMAKNTAAGAAGAKKAFRWADEAGEGSIDDAKRKGPSPLRNAAIDEESESSENISSETEAAPAAPAQEWVDEVPPPPQAEAEVKKPIFQVPRRAPTTTSAGVFGKDFLAAKAGRRSVSAAALPPRKPHEAPKPRTVVATRSSLDGNTGAGPSSGRVAFGEIRNASANQQPALQSLPTDDQNPFDENSSFSKSFTRDVSGTESKGSPYSRRASGAGSGGGVGPVRRTRSRASAGSPVTSRAADSSENGIISALPPVFAAIARERDAALKPTTMVRAPPGHAAARAAALASNSSDSDNDAGKRPGLVNKRASSAVRVPVGGSSASSSSATTARRPSPTAASASSAAASSSSFGPTATSAALRASRASAMH